CRLIRCQLFFVGGEADMVRHVPATRAPILALALGSAALALGCRATEQVSASAYVGSAACETCHEAQYRSWETTQHHLAMLPASPSGPLRAEPPDAGPMVVRDGRLLLVGSSVDHDTDLPLAYALGHRNVEQYVGPLQPGKLQALPLAFDVQRGEWFDL